VTYFRDTIDALAPYVPGSQPAAGEQVIKLNTNEHPYPPSPRALEVLRSFDGGLLRLYPDPMASGFRRAAARLVGFDEDWILPGNGSDDLIMMICRAAAGGRRRIVYPVPTFTFYETQARIEAAGPTEVPFDDDYNLPIDALAAAEGAVTFVANPNSPSGTAATTAELAELAGRLAGLLVIDEAYVDFADDSAVALARRENVIVLRTLSKGYSLAGLRLGYAVARPAVLEGLVKTKQIYNVGALAAAVGTAAVEDEAWHKANVAKVRASRARLAEGLEGLGWRVWPSQANFVLARPPGGEAEGVYEALKARGVLVRYFKRPRLEDKLRITVGTDEQNAALLAAVAEAYAE
jgi:histidinol-phosphate aminotransferase